MDFGSKIPKRSPSALDYVRPRRWEFEPEYPKGVCTMFFALRILARTSLNPIDVVSCVHHLRMAEDMAFACIILYPGPTQRFKLRRS